MDWEIAFTTNFLVFMVWSPFMLHSTSILPILGQSGVQNVDWKIAFTSTFILFIAWSPFLVYLTNIPLILGQPGARNADAYFAHAVFCIVFMALHLSGPLAHIFLPAVCGHFEIRIGEASHLGLPWPPLTAANKQNFSGLHLG